MLKNVDFHSLKKALIEEIKLGPQEAAWNARILINELDPIFEKSLKDWSEKRKYTNVKVKKIDIFALMHYEKLNYMEAVKILNEYYLDRISKENLEIIESTKKQEKQDGFWKTLYLIMFS